MSEQEILAVLVKERERCRQLVQLYQSLRVERGGLGTPDPEALRTANRILTQVLGHIRDLPRKPASMLQAEADRQQAERLLREIGDLLERAIVAERESRQPPAPLPAVPPAGPQMNKAMRMYART